jgi:predicted nucleic acid-binding protein
VRGILDTSVFVAQESGRPVEAPPQDAAISVATLAELHLGVLVAERDEIRARRLNTLTKVERTFDALPVDEEVARTFASIVAEARHLEHRPKVMDTLIAATAVTLGVPVYTQDADFQRIPRVDVVLV